MPVLMLDLVLAPDTPAVLGKPLIGTVRECCKHRSGREYLEAARAPAAQQLSSKQQTASKGDQSHGQHRDDAACPQAEKQNRRAAATGVHVRSGQLCLVFRVVLTILG